MKAVILKKAGLEPLLEVVERPVPNLKSTQVLVRVGAVGLCHHDISIMDGTIRRGVPENIVLGHEIAGNIVEIGSDVSDRTPGEQVITTLTSSCGQCEMCLKGSEYRCVYGLGFGHKLDGGLTEFIAVDARNVFPVSSNISVVEASLVACPIGVSVKALYDLAEIKSGQTIVVFGAGGGLGVHALQVASDVGTNVIAFTTSPHKLGELEALNIGQVFLSEDGIDPSELVHAFTEDRGADIVFNPVGSALLHSSVSSVALSGKILILGEIERPSASINVTELMFRDASLIGSTGADLLNIEKAISLVESGSVKPIIGSTLGFEDLLEAYTLVKRREPIGRIVLQP